MRAPASDLPVLSATTGTPCARAGNRFGQRVRIAEALEVQTDRGDARVIEHGVHRGRVAHGGTVAERDQIADWQRPFLHGQVQADIAGLRNDGDAAPHRRAAMLVRPDQDLIEVINKTVTIRAKERHTGRCFDQPCLEFASLRARFGKPGGERHRAAGTRRAEFSHQIDAGMPIDANKGGIRCGRQIGEGAIGASAGDFRRAWMQGPDFA